MAGIPAAIPVPPAAPPPIPVGAVPPPAPAVPAAAPLDPAALRQVEARQRARADIDRALDEFRAGGGAGAAAAPNSLPGAHAAPADANPVAANLTAAFSRLSVGQVRNGVPGSQTHVARHGAIGAGLHLVMVEVVSPPAPAAGAAAAPIAATEAHFTDAMVKSAYAAHCMHNVAGFDAAVDGAALAALCNLSGPSRKQGIILGAGRAGCAWAWQLELAELIASEVSAHRIYSLNMETGIVKLTDAAANAVWPDALCKLAIVAQSMAALTEPEAEVAMDAAILGVGAFALAGASLANNGHHYLTTENARALALFKQVTTGNGSSAHWAAMGDSAYIMNAVFHSVPHPVQAKILTNAAMSSDTAAKLDALGMAAGSVGIPVLPGLLKGAGTFLAVSNQVGTTMNNAGHTYALPMLQAIYDGLLEIGDGTERVAVAAVVLPRYMTAAQPMVAFAYGYYMGKLEETSQAAGTLAAAYSLVNAKLAYQMKYTEGLALVVTDKRYARNQLDIGYRQVIDLSD